METTRRFASGMASRIPVSSPTRRQFDSAASTLSRVSAAALRVMCAFAARFANRRFLFAVGVVAITSSKLVHIYAHITAIASRSILQWGLTFFTQDTAFLVLVRLLLDTEIYPWRWLRILLTTLASLLVLIVLALAAINNSFFVVAGAEPHWRNAGLASNASSWKLAVTGLFTCLVVLAVILVISWLTQDVFYFLAGLALDVLKWPFAFILSKLPYRLRPSAGVEYAHIPQQDVEGAELMGKEDDDAVSSGSSGSSRSSVVSDSRQTSRWIAALRVLVGLALFLQVVLYIARPSEGSYTYMSWTLPLLPFADFAHSSPILAALTPVYGNSIGWNWDNRTALAEPVRWQWLPEDPLPGFQDWYEEHERHYRASQDPLKISNLKNELLPELRGKLANVTIKHVVLVKLESTRKDAFPVKKDGLFYRLAAGSFENGTLPETAEAKISTLTPTANFLTGDYDDGFEHKEKKRRGGLNANNCHTSATYTLKSLTGTLCGLSPLVADFNAEVSHHIYQPCLPHILEAMNLGLGPGNSSKGAGKDDYTLHRWKSSFMMSVTNGFDKQDQLMVQLGFPENNTVSKEYLRSDDARFGRVDVEDINYYGMPEDVIQDYVRHAFETAKQNNERVFLTHLTSTTHHPFGLPENVTHVPITSEENTKLDNVSKYLNAVGFVDRWLQKVLDILDEQGVADETLVVLVGDHGLSIPENDGITPYYNSNIGNFHVPLVISHPQLPAVDIDDAVISYQILPTILDLLLETGSLSAPQTGIARDMIQNYEGQSLLRPLVNFNEKTGQPNWQFTVMNPGRATVAVRDARQPHWRLTVPIIENTEWRFTDLDTEPHEERHLVAFDFAAFLHKIEEERSAEAAHWAEEAAFVARWWVEENSMRWRYNPSE
ncbi:sulfatase domain [Trichoderma cornu-damae]|uniref:Sulfatase domain n=1 Tax=Trichoderma cornu-damae TaxID=654480 RepID=A0A9P8QYA4_9HYPO|nr:sulfatase domain [Trichoderma cornu-damae]